MLPDFANFLPFWLVSAKLTQLTGQKISKVRKQQKKNQFCQSYSYVNKKVWCHQIWIPSNLDFIMYLSKTFWSMVQKFCTSLQFYYSGYKKTVHTTYKNIGHLNHKYVLIYNFLEQGRRFCHVAGYIIIGVSIKSLCLIISQLTLFKKNTCNHFSSINNSFESWIFKWSLTWVENQRKGNKLLFLK